MGSGPGCCWYCLTRVYLRTFNSLTFFSFFVKRNLDSDLDVTHWHPMHRIWSADISLWLPGHLRDFHLMPVDKVSRHPVCHVPSPSFVIHIALFSEAGEPVLENRPGEVSSSKGYMFDQDVWGPRTSFTILSQAHFPPQILPAHVPEGDEREIVRKDGPCQLATLIFTSNLKTISCLSSPSEPLATVIFSTFSRSPKDQVSPGATGS